ncbi:MAG: hypothetical protein WBM44_28925 [Waterburya sp.]
MNRDPIENDPQFKEILAQADAEAEKNVKDHPRSMGFCHLFWSTKKDILRYKYGIDWKSPAEMNPDIRFD